MTLEQFQYGFDRDSRRTWRQRATTQGWDNAYVYDSLSQIIGDGRGDLNLARNAIAGIPANGARWQYDETGNWHGYQTLENGAPALTQARTHDKGNRLMEVSNAAAMRTDRAGRMTEVPYARADGDWSSPASIVWDAWGRITYVSVPDFSIHAYSWYDGLHRRIMHTDAAYQMVHSYYNDAWKPVEERMNSDTTASLCYLWGDRHRDDLVRRDRAVGGTTLNESRYVLMDYFSPAAITDENGAVTERYQFSAFGLRTILNPDFTVRSDSECEMEFAFQGQFEDVQTGWLDYGYRYYLPALGRWACKDPIREMGGTNLYRCSSNDPLNFVDYLGLKCSCDESAVTDAVYQGSLAAAVETAKSATQAIYRREYCGIVCCNKKTKEVWRSAPHSGPPWKALPGGGIEQAHSCSPFEKGTCSNKGPDWELGGIFHSHPEDTPLSKDDRDLSKKYDVPMGVGKPDKSVDMGYPDGHGFNTSGSGKGYGITEGYTPSNRGY